MMFRKSLIAICLFCATSPLYADVNATHPWKFVIAPYLWAINLNGNTQIGSLNVPVKEDFGDLFKHLNFGGMLYVSAAKNKKGVFLDAVYSKISTKKTLLGINLKATNEYGIFTQGLTYEIYKKAFNAPERFITVTPYIGAREILNNTTITANSAFFNSSVTGNHSWADPIIGTQIDSHFNKNWSFLFFADGGAAASSNYTYRFSGLLGYKPTSLKSTRFYFGYQLLSVNYKIGSGIHTYAWNMDNYGPLLGVALTF